MKEQPEDRLKQLAEAGAATVSPSIQRMLEKAASGTVLEEPTGVLAGKPAKITPYIPYYCAEPNEVLEKWNEEFTDRCGNTATLTIVKFRNKKKPNAEPTTAVIRVKWHKLFAYLDRK